jgi:hypothetical protein
MAVTDLVFHIRSSASRVATEDGPYVDSSPVDVHDTPPLGLPLTLSLRQPIVITSITDRTATRLGMLDPENKGTTIFDKSG